MTSDVNNDQYVIDEISRNTTVKATFEMIPPTTYSLTITSSGSGSVSYSNYTINEETRSFTVDEGTSAILTITPNSGYRIKSLKVNGADVSSYISNNKFTINNIQLNTTVSVVFEAISPTTYTLTIASSGSGYVSYSGNTINGETKSYTVHEGSSAFFVFTPNSGYQVGSLKVDGVDVMSNMTDNQYTIRNITQDTKVEVEFESVTYSLTITSLSNGRVYCAEEPVYNAVKVFTFNEGASVELIFQPNNGYRLKLLSVNGKDVTSDVVDNQYTISSINDNTMVSVVFEAIPQTTYSLSITSSGSGFVTYSGNTINGTTKSFTVNEGTSLTLIFTPNSGYRLSSVKVNDVDVTSSVSNNTYTINSINKNTTVSVAFVEELKSMTVDKVNYIVSSYDNRTVKVAAGSYGNVLTVPATFTYQGMEWNVTGIDKGALTGNTELAAIVWYPSVAFTESVSNPNLLLYVKAAQYAPSEIKNVVVNGVANSITLTEAASGNDFYCPQTFTAQSIIYTHNYSMITGVGECRGWETIALPFNVQTITHSTKGEIVPFGVWSGNESRRPFWLYELTSSGWREASTIKAYKPYIISMPNNDLYYDEARLNGSITFSAQNLTIGVTEVETSTYGERTFTPSFSNKAVASNVYVLNVVNSLVANTGGLTEGSQFVQDLRAVHPFEAYMTTTNNARTSFGIFEDMTTSIRGITELIDKERSKDIYNLKGQKIEAEKEGGLPAGMYIINGQKMMVK